MIEGTISYFAATQSCKSTQFEIPLSHKFIKKISFEINSKSNLAIVFFLKNVFSEDEAKYITKDILDRVLNFLSIQFDIQVSEPKCENWDLPKVESKVRQKGVTACLDAIIVFDEVELNLSENELKEIKKIIDVEELDKDNLHSGYRFAINQSDPVAKYMFLYNMLLRAVAKGPKDEQEKVDDFIKKKVSDVVLTPRSDRPNIKETIFTRLRNEVGHKRKKALPQNTYKEICNKVGELQNLVRNAILSENS